jgi:hypothetical protein
MPLADPECFGAMSIGTARSGATISSTEKNAAASEIAATSQVALPVHLLVTMTDIQERKLVEALKTVRKHGRAGR